MLKKNTNWRNAILFGLTFCLCPAVVEAKSQPLARRLTVAVHDHAGVSADTLAEAERTAEAIFKDAGLELQLVDCEPPPEETQAERACTTPQFPNYLQLTIAGRSTSLKDSALGVAYLGPDGTGCYSDVFLKPTEDVQERVLLLRVGVLLGHVMAHEIAHLLLGRDSHSTTGIMRAHWTVQDLESAAKHALLFTQSQATTMRARVAESLCPAESGLIATRRGLEPAN